MAKFFRWTAVATGVACVALALGACSSTGAGASPGAATPSASSTLSALVPAAVRAKGALAGGASFDTRPMNFYAPGNKPDGVIIDLLDAAAGKLALTITWSHVPYAGLIPAMQAGRVDIAGAQISKTPEDSGVVNLLAFYKASSSLLVKHGTTYGSPLDACGTRFGITTGSTVNKNIADGVNAQCKSAGKPALKYFYYSSFNAGEDAVRSGRIDSFLNSTPQVQLAAAADNTVAATLVGKLAVRVTGVALPKDDGALTKAFQAALNAMIADGQYQQILKKWNLGYMAVDKALINDQIPS